MDKKQLTETDIRTKFIAPALIGTSSAKWNVMAQLEGLLHQGPRDHPWQDGSSARSQEADCILYF